ncbi:DNA replication/repair protein RecF [uncultured Dialister sp.]|uniref:DNA replication/repair protein RecF n=1 Tax=uncultured Dialister sp. TaxID=278064 RepID=UPI0026DB9316|nr:DNA replication/repair protein RecF [uncultured Dialister sp.]
MKCLSFRLIQIRNFKDRTVEPSPALTFFTGPNGCGKTNLLEALYYSSVGKSFRTSNDGEIIRIGDDEGTILVNFSVHQVEQSIKIKLTRGQGKKIFLNDTPIRRKELMGLFRTVLFTPDELQLIKGAPQLRRRFLDMEISQVSPRYYEEFLRYSRAVQQRNGALKNALATGKKPDLDMWDMQIASGASYMVKKRMETISRMNETLMDMEQRLTNRRERLEIRYNQQGSHEPRWDMEWYMEELSRRREEDERFCHTSIGSHRDDLTFLLNGMDISAYGSQGQQRTAILSMKLSEMEFIREETGEYPVLILDDIGSELDRERRKALVTFLMDKEIQTLVTGTEVPFDVEGKVVDLGKYGLNETPHQE